jgi:hypothetical protein
MNIAILTIGTNDVKFYSKYVFPINQAYAHKHGYCYIQYNQTLDITRPIPWSKILAIKQQLNNYDWILYIDADAIFFNHDIRIENFIDKQYNLIISKAMGQSWVDKYYLNNSEFVNINTGVFIIKGKSTWSSCLLNYIYDKTDRINHSWWENQALSDVYKENNVYFNSKIKIMDQYTLNGFENFMYDYKEFDNNQYILHWAGMPSYDKEYLAKIRYEEFLNGKFTDTKNHTRFRYEPSI